MQDYPCIKGIVVLYFDMCTFRAYENFQECYEKIIKRKCSLMYEDVAIDLAAVVEIPPVMHFLPENCPLLDRLPVPRKDIMTWNSFPHYRPFVRGIHWRTPITKGRWRRAMPISVVLASTMCWINIYVAGDLRRHNIGRGAVGWVGWWQYIPGISKVVMAGCQL